MICSVDFAFRNREFAQRTKEKLQKLWTPRITSAAPLARHMVFLFPCCSFQIPRRRTPHHLATEKIGKGSSRSQKATAAFWAGSPLEMPKQRNGKWRWSIQLRAACSSWNGVNTSHVDLLPYGLLHFPHLSSSSLRDPHLLFIFLFEVQSSQSRNGARVEEIQISRDSLVRGIPKFIGRHPNKQDSRTEWLPCLDIELANIPQGHVLFPEKIGRDDFLGSFFVAGSSWKVVISRGYKIVFEFDGSNPRSNHPCN